MKLKPTDRTSFDELTAHDPYLFTNRLFSSLNPGLELERFQLTPAHIQRL